MTRLGASSETNELMHAMRGWRALTISIILITLGGCSRSPDVRTVQHIQRVEHGLLGELNDPPWRAMDLLERMAYYNVPGVSIAVIDDYQIEWARGYGVLEAGGDRAVTPETLFQAASIGKPVVAVAALDYVERGLLELDRDINLDLVSWQVPENVYIAQEKVTLRRLLSHSAGVTIHGFTGYKQGEAIPDLQQILNGEPPANSPPIVVDFVPGTQWRYSGGGFMIVQQLLEDIAGEPFPGIMRRTVLGPAGMAATTFESPLPQESMVFAASGHRSNGTVIPGGGHIYPEMGAGGSIWSTASDMARFAIDVMLSFSGEAKGTLTHDMAIEMLTPQVGDTGLGVALGDDGGDRFYFFHDGGNEGFKSVMVGYPERGQGAIILTNSDNGDMLWREILNSLSVEYGWVEDRTGLYATLGTVIVLAILGFIFVRSSRSRITKTERQPSG